MSYMPVTKYYHQFVKTLPQQVGRIVVITGTTSGTGYIAARTSLSLGANVIVLNRDSARAEESMEKLHTDVPNSEDRLHWVKCDLQDFESVKAAAKEIKEKFPEGIHVLANNAGVMALKDIATKDGYDVQMQTNHLSHFLLTKELYPLLQKAAEKATKEGDIRIVNHSSGARYKPPTPLKAKYYEKRGGNLGGDSNNMFIGGRWERYHQTKLANSVFTLELAAKLKKKDPHTKIYAVCAHPGLTATELQKTTLKDDGLQSLDLMKNSQSPEDGSMGILTAMFAKDVVNGGLYGPAYRSGPVAQRYHGLLSSYRAMRVCWEQSEKACGKFEV